MSRRVRIYLTFSPSQKIARSLLTSADPLLFIYIYILSSPFPPFLPFSPVIPFRSISSLAATE